MKTIIKNLFIKLLILSNLSLCTTLAFADSGLNKIINTCVACHGSNGITKINQYPNLAGQKKGYLFAQLKAFKDGTRSNPVMAQQLTNLSDKQMLEVSSYYSELPFVKSEAPTINKVGKNIRANCLSCHGMTGKTVNETWPNLAGQNSEYLFKQLMDFSTEKRKSMIMNVIASELNEQQMKEVSKYYEQIGSN